MEYMIVNGELYHHGTKGMRWGIRRYQNKDGSLTPAGRKRYSEELERYEAKAEEYRKKLGTSKSGKTEAEESLEQKKKKILDTHDAKQIYKNKDLFSDKEILDAYNRLNNERNIKNLIPEEKSKAQQIIDRYTKTSKTVKSVVDSSDDLYKSYVKGESLVKAILEKTGKVKHSDINEQEVTDMTESQLFVESYLAHHDLKPDELAHYGVLGMKWGVRRGNASKAYYKASKKRAKLEKKAVEAKRAGAILSEKALKKEVRARNDKQYKKARKLQYKANQYTLKGMNLEKKGLKWEKKMEKVFKETKLSDIQPEHLERGKKYTYMLING